jgi:hypothetical protein
MASRIVPTNIDGTYPVAGQDNSSQGFRDNFTNIKNNFTFARNEISDLQSKAILTAALDGATLDNDMAGTQLIRPQLKAWTQALVDKGSVSGTVNVSFDQGNFQKITAAGSIILGLIDWPASAGAGTTGYGAVRVWIVISDYTTQTVTLPASVSIGVNDISGYNSSSNTITFDANGNYIFDFSSIDGGTTYFIADPMRNRSTIRGNTSVTGALTVTGNVNMSSNLTLVNSVVSPRSSAVITGSADGNILLPQNNGVMLHITGQTGYPGRFYLDGQGAGNYAAFVGRRYNGNVNYPTVVNSGEIVARFGATPYHGNTSVNSGWPTITTTRIDMLADETQTQSNIGSRLEFYTTNTQTTTAVKKLTINTAGIVANANLFVSNTYVPSLATSGGAAGQISYDTNYVYICLGANNWKRANLAAW